jgi:hypothetical protein
MKFSGIFLFCVMLASGCQQRKQAPEPLTKETTASLPVVPADILNRLMDECTGIDYVFTDLPFSLSFQEEPGIDQNIAFIDPSRPVEGIPADCKPMARKLFLIKGEIAYEADVYLSGKCRFYVFLNKDKTPMYANQMTEAGINYYAQVVNQAQGMGQQAK